MNRYGNWSVYQRNSDKRWCVKIPCIDPETGKRKVKVVYGKTEREVMRKAREYRATLVRRPPVERR